MGSNPNLAFKSLLIETTGKHLPWQEVGFADHETVKVKVITSRWHHHERVQAKRNAPRQCNDSDADLKWKQNYKWLFVFQLLAFSWQLTNQALVFNALFTSAHLLQCDLSHNEISSLHVRISSIRGKNWLSWTRRHQFKRTKIPPIISSKERLEIFGISG